MTTNNLLLRYNKLDNKLKNDLNFLIIFLSSYTTRAYIVGGSVRDFLLKQKIEDIDIEVYDIKVELFDSIMKKIGAKSVGKSFFVYKYNNIDISLARSESKTSNHHRGFDVVVENNEKKATIRRDFKMNSLLFGLFDSKIVDFFDGKKDIENKIISIIDEEKFKEDSLRVLRALQFSSRFDFRCDDLSVKIMQNIDLSNISKSRIFTEMKKMFLSNYLHIGWYYFVKLGVAKKIFNIDCSFSKFVSIYKILKNKQISSKHNLYKYYFLYVVLNKLKIHKKVFFKNEIFPNEYKKYICSKKYIPKNPSNRFLCAIAIKNPLIEHIGCVGDVLKKSKKLGIYKVKFIPTHSIQDIIISTKQKKDIQASYIRKAYLDIKLV